MGKQLRTYVHVPQEDGSTKVYGPDDDVPAEDAKKIGDHAWLADGEEPITDTPAGQVVHEAAPAKSKSRK